MSDQSRVSAIVTRLLDITMILVGVTATIAVGALFRQVFLTPPQPATAAPRALSQTVIPPDEWNQLKAAVTWLGPADREAQVVEFTDFQCPYCAALEPQLARLRAEYGRRLSFGIAYFPLRDIHPYAYPAALSAVCARLQGRLLDIADTMYRRQESFGTVPFDSLARFAGVSDLASFKHCRESSQARAMVDRDLRWASRLSLDGTPTVFVNGKLIPAASVDAGIQAAIIQALDTHSGALRRLQ